MALMGHVDIKSSLRYVRSTDPTLRAAVEATTLAFREQTQGACPQYVPKSLEGGFLTQ